MKNIMANDTDRTHDRERAANDRNATAPDIKADCGHRGQRLICIEYGWMQGWYVCPECAVEYRLDA